MFPGSVVGGSARRFHWKALSPARGSSRDRGGGPKPPPPPAGGAGVPGADRVYVSRTFPPASRNSSLTVTAESGAVASEKYTFAPNGGLRPAVVVAGDGPPASRAGRGVNRCAAAAMVCPLICRSGLRSSNAQNARPSVDAYRSPWRTSRSVIGTTGRFRDSDCQLVPPLNDTYTPVSVPA